MDCEAKAWIKRKNAPDEVVRIVYGLENKGKISNYDLFTAYDQPSAFLGRILFDAQGYWIYDGDILTVDEQEQMARFIINYVDRIR